MVSSAAHERGIKMEDTTMTNRVRDSLNHDLSTALHEVIKDYDIKLYEDDSTKDSDTAITIFVSSSTMKPKTSKKNKKLKVFNLQIAYSLELTFDLKSLIGTKQSPLSLNIIYMHTKPEKTQIVMNRINFWSKALFKKVYSLFEEYSLHLSMLPFEFYGDINDEFYISKLPTFDDLCFFDKKDPNKELDKDVFIQEQVNSLLEAAKSLESHKLCNNSKL